MGGPPLEPIIQRGGTPLEFINQMGGPPLDFINMQPPKRGSATRIHQHTAQKTVSASRIHQHAASQRGSASRIHQHTGTISMDLAVCFPKLKLIFKHFSQLAHWGTCIFTKSKKLDFALGWRQQVHI